MKIFVICLLFSQLLLTVIREQLYLFAQFCHVSIKRKKQFPNRKPEKNKRLFFLDE